MNAAPSELLTVDQFAQRLQVSRTTVFSWLKKGELREDIDYIRFGRVIRFRWPIFNSPPPTQPTARVERQALPPKAIPYRKKRNRFRRGGTPAVNLDY